MLNLMKNNGTDIIDIFNTRYAQSEVDTLISTSYNTTETANLLNQKANTPGKSFIQGSLGAYLFRCGEIKLTKGDDLNSLTLTQLSANRNIIDLRTEVSFADMYSKVKGFSYIGLSTTDNTYYIV